jgi:hypothetical protein
MNVTYMLHEVTLGTVRNDGRSNLLMVYIITSHKVGKNQVLDMVIELYNTLRPRYIAVFYDPDFSEKIDKIVNHGNVQ